MDSINLFYRALWKLFDLEYCISPFIKEWDYAVKISK